MWNRRCGDKIAFDQRQRGRSREREGARRRHGLADHADALGVVVWRRDLRAEVRGFRGDWRKYTVDVRLNDETLDRQREYRQPRAEHVRAPRSGQGEGLLTRQSTAMLRSVGAVV